MRGRHVSAHIWPQSPRGRIAGRVAALGAGIFLLSIAFSLAGIQGAWVGVPSLIALGCLVVAGAVALVAIVRQGERSLVAIALTMIAVLVLVFLLGELLVPHE